MEKATVYFFLIRKMVLSQEEKVLRSLFQNGDADKIIFDFHLLKGNYIIHNIKPTREPKKSSLSNVLTDKIVTKGLLEKKKIKRLYRTYNNTFQQYV